MNQGALYLDTLIRAIEYFVYRILRHILDRRLDRKIIFFKQRLYLPENHGIFIFAQRSDYFWAKADGTFRNVALFSGEYKVAPTEGPFFPITEEVVNLKGVTDHNFNVTPVLKIK